MEEEISHIEMRLNINAVYLLYDSIRFYYENCPDNLDDTKLEELNFMKNLLYKIILDYKFEHM